MATTSRMRYMKKIPIFAISLFLPFAGFPAPASSSVLVHDSIALKSEEIMINAETKGRFFVKGGQVVEFFVNGKSIGRVLSGGDGSAYKSFIPRKYGLHEIIVKYGNDKDRGVILSLRKGSRLVFIDIEGSLLINPFSKEPIDKGREAIKKIIKKYRVVYLQTGFTGVKLVKEWLKKEKFPESVVLQWLNGEIFHDLNEKGLKIRAIIGSQQVIESARDYKPKAFSFDDFDDAENVKDWDEIEKKLK
jgi:hypothetical protein